MQEVNDKIQKSKVNKGSIIEQAAKFLEKQIEKKEFVIDYTNIPSRKVREFLKSNDLLYSPCKFIYIIKDKTKTNKSVLEHNYFNIVSKLGGVVTGDIALNYHLGKTAKVKNIDIITSTKNGDMNLGEDDTYIVRYQKSDIYREVEPVRINNAKIYIETPTSYLINNFSEEKTKEEDFKVLLSSTNFMLGDVKKLIDKGASVTSLSRMALWYKDNEKPRNYALIKTALQQSGKQINYAKDNETSSSVDDLSKLLTSSLNYDNEEEPDVNPKLARFETFINKLDKQANDALLKQDLTYVEFKDLNTLLNNIEQNIVHDSYHSLTIENYNVSKKDIDFLNKPTKYKTEVEDIENKLAIKGYLHAYREIVDQIKIDYGYGTKINKGFIIHINSKLFEEFSKVKNFEPNERYRTYNIEITGTTHLPPDHSLVEEYMSMFVDYVNKIDTSEKEGIIKKAVMTHFLFVYIHPFGDGNGRTARFLMNHVLGSEKLDWITILSDRKKEYIESLKKASENEDISDFTNLITYYLKQK